MNNQSPQQFQQYPQPPSFQNDEIDLKELFLALWAGKLWIIGLTLSFAIGATIFAVQSPNIYESKAVLVVDADPYGFGVERGEIFQNNQQASAIATAVEPFIVSSKIINLLTDKTNQPITLNSSIDKKNGQITLSKQGEDPAVIFGEVKAYSDNISLVYKQLEIEKIEASLIPIQQVLNSETNNKVQDVLAEKYAQQLYKIALLKSPSTELIRVIQQPVKAISHIKPKRALIIVLGTLLGGMLGVALVLVRFAFRKEELETRN